MEETAVATGELFSIKAIRCDPSDLGTADCAYVCRCEDGSDYAIKSDKPTATAPHSEWLCYHLGERVGLASPPCRVVELLDKALFLGSRWETGEIKNWWGKLQSGAINIDDLKQALSRIYAFDLFVHNIDRHLNNFLVRKQHKGYAVIAMDYSRAWLANGIPPPDLPFPTSCSTVAAHRILRATAGEFFVLDEARNVLSNISKVNVGEISNIIKLHPNNWLTNTQSEDIINWWKSPQREQRISKIVAGLGDGTYR
jgi:hypothetical protein